ncbi:MAG: class I SAM-dependent methyltransferase [Chloroflexota bacterium]|nr:class I SAM-dependent methyltransferase [Chloroflexota bacterium]MDE2895332.1 class I SAM-dependent methyltransferase [Chloroflexota bacterium]
MLYLIDEQRIRAALRLAGLSYVEDLNTDLPRQAGLWLSMMLDAPRNLTAVREPQAAIEKHVIEPLSGRHRLFLADLPIPDGPLIDVGSGNGAPGLPLALCEPHRATTLLDSRAGATRFLERVVEQIDAPGIDVRQQRAEQAAHSELRERFAMAVSRAAATPTIALELMLPFLQIGGIAAAWTGRLSDAENQAVVAALQELGAEPTPIDPPPDIIVATKVRPSEARYPRSWSMIRRRPLGARRV